MRLPSASCRWLAGLFLLIAAPALGQPAAPAPPTTTNEAARQQYAAAVALQNRELYGDAAEEWETFLKRFASDPLAGRAQHYLGVCRLQNKEYDKAVAAFLQVIRTYPKFELLENSWYLLALSQFNAAQAGKMDVGQEKSVAEPVFDWLGSVTDYLETVTHKLSEEALPKAQSSQTLCPQCGSQNIRKNGHRGIKQKYLCKDCRKQFTGSIEESVTLSRPKKTDRRKTKGFG